jgi:hypothetical protein
VVNVSSSVKAVLVSGVAIALSAPASIAQSPTDNEATYSLLLQQIADQKISIAQQQVYVAGQEEEISSLQSQIAGLEEIKAALPSMVEKMTAAIVDEVNADYPFDAAARAARVGRLEDMMKDPTARLVDKYRRALDVYKIEVNYGQSLEAYQGNHPITPTIRQGDDRYKKDTKDEFEGEFELDKNGQLIEIFDGNYLRYGRTAYVYLNSDGTDPLRFDLNYEPTADELEKCQGDVVKCKWRKIPKGKTVEIRRAIRVSRGEVAPTVIAAPVSPMP